jgi:hypothetical protein
MSITTAQNIIDDAEELLQDESNDRWDAAEHLKAVNDGMKAICIFKPDAYTVSESVTLAAGVEQDLPTGGTQLVAITRNMGVSPGETRGERIKLIERAVLDAMDPDWASQTASATVDYYMYDPKFPTIFSVSPPQPATAFGYVEMIYYKTPTEIASDATILVPDIYRPVLLDYVLYRAFAKDAAITQNANRMNMHRESFLNCLMAREQKEEADKPLE